MGYVGSKTKSLGQILEKCVYQLRPHFQSDYQETWSESFVLMKSQMSLKIGHDRSKTGSIGQFLEKPCVQSEARFSVRLS